MPFFDRMKGLLSSPQQQQSLLGSPAFGAGMGLLASAYDPKVNPFQAAMQGLASSSAYTKQEEDRQRIAQLRKELSELLARQGAGGLPPPSAVPGGASSFMSPVQPGTSMTDQLMQKLAWGNLL